MAQNTPIKFFSGRASTYLAEKIAKKFASVDHFGPVAVADFQEVTDEEERAFIQRDAYERTAAILSALGIA